MKHGFAKCLLAIVATACTLSGMTAQNISSAYFLEGSFDRYKLNPALTPERVFASLPVLGGMSFDANMNVGLGNFIYESKSYPGSLTTFMSKDVDAAEFLDALPDASALRLNMDMDILAFGFGQERWYAWLDCNFKSRTGLSVPKEMFKFMKYSLSSGNYHISDLNVQSVNYIETALGFQFRPISNLSAGVSLKILDGVAYAKAGIDDMDVSTTGEKWSLKANASVRTSIPGCRMEIEEDRISEISTGSEFVNTTPNLGIALDMGAEYDFKELVPGLKVSASLTDLGMIKWKDVEVLETDNSEYVEFDGFLPDSKADEIGDDLKGMLKMYAKGDGVVKSGLDATLRIGAGYTLPMVSWLSFGELVTSRLGLYGYTESRTSVMLTPLKWLDVETDFSVSGIGTAFGGMINIHPAGANLFIAGEFANIEVNPQYIPTDMFSANVSMGVRFGLSKLRY